MNKTLVMEAQLDLLNETFAISEDSPSGLIYKNPHKRSVYVAGDIVGTLDVEGYYRVRIAGVTLRNHRIVYILLTQSPIPVGMQIDHINGIRTDNSTSNLRMVSHAVNHRNKSMRSDNSSGIVGVSLKEDSVVAQVHINGKLVNKQYSYGKHGKDNAIAMAIAWRNSKIEELNLLGYGYTDRHCI